MFARSRPRSTPLFALLAVVALLALAGVGGALDRTVAQDSTPPASGSVGIAGKVLGAVDPLVAPGYRLEMFYMEWAPDSSVTAHYHPMSFVTCVAAGALGFTLVDGAVTLTRAGAGEMPETTEQVQPNVEVILEPLDCISVDNDVARTIHTARNASDETTIAWEADFYPVVEPVTVFVDEFGTPIP